MLAISVSLAAFPVVFVQAEGSETETGTALVCDPSQNLIQNGGFETPELPNDGFGWDVFDSGFPGLAWLVEWVFPSEDSPNPAKLELQGSYFTPKEGKQYAELDSNFNPAAGGPFSGEKAGVRILQTIPTIPGYNYTVSYAFSPRPGYDAASNVLVAKRGTEVQGTHSADGTALTDSSWSTYSYSFVATSDETTVSFEDAGTQDTFGTFIDDVSVRCDGREGGGDTFHTLTLTLSGQGFGMVSDDSEEGGIQCSTAGGETNNCSQSYLAGTVVTLTATPDAGSNFDNSWEVGAGTCTGNTSPCTVTMTGNLALTAHFDVNNQSRSGTRVRERATPMPLVLGEATTTPEMLDGQVEVVPVGAPNTGAGGMSPVGGLTLLSLLYTGTRRTSVVGK